ncbi:hypothetical protein OUZ56_017493 [Daphnia magna]|uniref:Uncharacterized protein n=1 Tax=Daphnia magna TaxID=35525 RepID=A0ABR0ATC5_9CRUS|nr:hypothetical protein OUZ56_017493 [Daphnia magna]
MKARSDILRMSDGAVEGGQNQKKKYIHRTSKSDIGLSGGYQKDVQYPAQKADCYYFTSGLLDTFPSATREFRVQSLFALKVSHLSLERGSPASPTETYPTSH